MTTDQQLWCLHIQGPDDMHPAPSKEAAEIAAARLQRYWDRSQRAAQRIVCVAAPWPWSAESHAAGLKEWAALTEGYPE
jgi:hypothetical protein